MKTLLISAAVAALTLGAAPLSASDLGAGLRIAGAAAMDADMAGADHFDRRGRGRGRGGDGRDSRDDARDDRDRDRDRGGHGGRPRIPGGSGCDDPHDIIEHPECRL